MRIKARIRRLWLGADLNTRTISTIGVAESAERQGRALAEEFIRKVHAEHPNPERACAIPDCCDPIVEARP